MQRTKRVEFVRLFGFEAVEQDITGIVDFQHEAFGARLGAKVGTETMIVLDPPSEFPPEPED
jgi:hypothetical protein